MADPVTRQVLSASPLDGFTGVGAPTRGGYVFLFVAGQERALGVGVVDANGSVRTAMLDRIRDAGEALAVDPVSGHAYVVGADNLVADIDAGTLAVGTETGMGVAAYGLDGELRWRALGGEPVSRAQTGGGYAYIPKQDSFPQRVRVIDVSVGRVVRVVRADRPWLLVQEG